MSQITSIYANAVMDLSVEMKVDEKVLDELLLIKKLFDQNDKIYDLIATPVLSNDEKIRIIDDIFSSYDIEILVINFIKILIENNRIKYFSKIVDDYKEKYYKRNNIIEVKVFTVKQLSNNQLQKLGEKLTLLFKKSIVINNEIDESIIGGILLKVNNKQMDSTIKYKLNEVSELICKTIL